MPTPMEMYPDLFRTPYEEIAEVYDFDGCWTKMHPDAEYEEKDVVAAMLYTRCNYTRMSRLLGRSRRSVEGFVLRNLFVRELAEDIRNEQLDMVEEGQFTAALMGDTAAGRFILDRLAKERGYVTRTEQTGKDGKPLWTQSKVDPKKLSDDVLQQILEAGDAEGTP